MRENFLLYVSFNFNILHTHPLSLPLSCSVCPQVNNATARVVTKKPQTPLVNAEISSKTPHSSLHISLCVLRDSGKLILIFCAASGWKINPVMGAMYAPELYTGEIRLICYYNVTSIVLVTIYTIYVFFFSCQFPVSCSNSHLGLPGLCAARSRSSRLQHDSLCCSHAYCCARLPRVRLSVSKYQCLVCIHFIHCFNILILFLSGWCIRMDCMEQKST